jgi:transposase InsO family protein
MNVNQADFPVRTMCRVLGVSHSGFYGWLERPPSRHAMADAVLGERIRTVHAESHETYGMPRIRAELADQGVRVGGKRIARLMRVAGLRGVSKRRGFVVTTRRDAKRTPAPDLVRRAFRAEAPDQLWVADMTYVPTWAGFIYLATVLDVWNQGVVGWSIGERMTSDLVLAALNMAVSQRKPRDVIHHSDQGSQYNKHRLRQPMRGDGRAAVDGQRGRRLRQRDGRELLCHARMRVDRQALLQDQGRGAHRALQLHRRLVQPAATALARMTGAKRRTLA